MVATSELTEASSVYYVGWFAVLLAVLIGFRKVSEDPSQKKTVSVVTVEFKRFQRLFLLVYLLAMGADWLQGPYVYELYQHYGYSIEEIGQLFIVGFGSSLLAGLLVGTAADKYGRKMMCLCFSVCYGLACVTKHFSNYRVLMLGRLLGGVSTSILFSSFEAWMVHEHHENGYPDDWLALTFSLATAGNGVVAIGAGVVASMAREQWGPVAPFDVSMLCLVAVGIIVYRGWPENTGETKVELQVMLANAASRMMQDRKIPLLGIIQSLFEGAMYIFVFMWTPALQSTSSGRILHGWIFASFMICVMAGSQVFTLLLARGHAVERIAVPMFLTAAVALLVPAFTASHTLRLLSFFVFEGCVGMFWPSLGFMRSRYVPEEVRATVMNIFRVPLNLIVVIVLINIGWVSERWVFFTCTACLLGACAAQSHLSALVAGDDKKNTPPVPPPQPQQQQQPDADTEQPAARDADSAPLLPASTAS